jgi:hydroxylamine dehydrogenase
MSLTPLRVLGVLGALVAASWLGSRMLSSREPAASPPKPEVVGAAAPAPQADVLASLDATDRKCIECHRERQPGLVAQFLESKHLGQGVGCAACHGDDHEQIFRVKGYVAESVCGACHAEETEEFRRSPHHKARTKALVSARLMAQIPAMQRIGCLGCHDQGARGPAESELPDDGRCASCHGGHRFASADARKPEACGLCHRGPDHPHIEAWEASPHGVAWRASGGDERQAPTCSTCHMPGGSHDVSVGVGLGAVGSGAVLEGDPLPIPMKVVSKGQVEQAREQMLTTCQRCHTPRVARKALEDADAVKRECDRLVGVGAEILRGLGRDGLIVPDPQERMAHPTAGHALVVGGAMLYEEHSEAERIFFDLAKFAHAITFKAAYHQSPDWTHWLGMARLKAGLEALKAEERRLRAPR